MRPRWDVTILVGTPLWSQRGFEFKLGSFRWLWFAKLMAWWHIVNHPYREAGITLSTKHQRKKHDSR